MPFDAPPIARIYTYTYILTPPPSIPIPNHPPFHYFQELCRVLFEALEKVLAGTAHATLVNDLYQARCF